MVKLHWLQALPILALAFTIAIPQMVWHLVQLLVTILVNQ